MATTIWLLRTGDDLGRPGRFYSVTDELADDYVRKGYAQRLKGERLRRPDPADADALADPETPDDAQPRKPGRPRKQS